MRKLNKLKLIFIKQKKILKKKKKKKGIYMVVENASYSEAPSFCFKPDCKTAKNDD